MRLGDLPEQGEWVKLAGDPPNELGFGASAASGAVRRLGDDRRREFVAFDEPGFARIGCSVSLRR